jgi:hypothetical protein
VIKSILKLQHEDQSMNLIQDRIIDAVTPILGKEILDSEILHGVVLSSGANTVDHKLGRDLVGWVVTRINAAITIFDTQATNPLPHKNLKLTTSGAAIVDLLVF